MVSWNQTSKIMGPVSWKDKRDGRYMNKLDNVNNRDLDYDQELAIVDDLLFWMMGVREGTYIKCYRNENDKNNTAILQGDDKNYSVWR